jgi:type IV pilus assembly protein PilC
MPTYTFKAKDRSGNAVDGTVDAPDSAAAAGKIREMGYWPMDVKAQGGVRTEAPQQTAVRGSFNPLWTGVSVHAQAVFFRQLATMLSSGMALSESLDNLSSQRDMGRLPSIARAAAEHVRQGRAFSEVLAMHPGIFSRVQIGLIRAGETGGMLDTMVARIADYIEREATLRRKFSRITFYPKLVIIFIVLVLVFMQSVPEILSRPGPVILAILKYKLLPLALILVGIWAAARLLLALPPIRYAWDWVKLVFPVLGSITSKLAMSRFALTLSVLHSAGLPLPQSIEYSSDAIGNEVLRRSVLYAVPRLRAGGVLSEALGHTKVVPDMVIGMISTGERSGSMDSILQKVSDYYDDESSASIEKLGYVLFVLLILGLGSVVGYIFIRFFMELYGGLTKVGG